MRRGPATPKTTESVTRESVPAIALTCPVCGCPIHARPQTWEVTCVACGQKRWPMTVTKPEGYVCPRCRGTSPEMREAARAAGKRSAESRRKARVR
jgi:Zn finger protein HypA/HybF involved in hydrogenase expression